MAGYGIINCETDHEAFCDFIEQFGSEKVLTSIMCAADDHKAYILLRRRILRAVGLKEAK
jgi:hypothetical protein